MKNIIGDGDIGKVLHEISRPDLLFFASGVSNSKETRESEYEREISLLLRQGKGRHIVYFSTLAIFYSDTRYTQHKRQIEAIIRSFFNRYTIVRLGNITWGDNPHTIINFFRNKVKKGEKIEIEDTYRYLIDKDEFLDWMKMIPEWSCELNLNGKRLKVADIVKEYVNIK